MDDMKFWEIEEQLWRQGASAYQRNVSPDCLMVFAAPVGILGGERIRASLADGPRWSSVDMSQQVLARPGTDTVVLAYLAKGEREGQQSPYQALCTSTYCHRGGDRWWLVQHQQTPLDP
jgi:hypothetical protein